MPRPRPTRHHALRGIDCLAEHGAFDGELHAGRGVDDVTAVEASQQVREAGVAESTLRGVDHLRERDSADALWISPGIGEHQRARKPGRRLPLADRDVGDGNGGECRQIGRLGLDTRGDLR